MKLQNTHTADLVAYFKAGLTMREIATRSGLPMVKIEEAIRRWLLLYPGGKKGAV